MVSEKEQTDAFFGDLTALVDRYKAEFDLSYAVVLGCLALKAHQLADEAVNSTKE